jgi:hypothetical protein
MPLVLVRIPVAHTGSDVRRVTPRLYWPTVRQRLAHALCCVLAVQHCDTEMSARIWEQESVSAVREVCRAGVQPRPGSATLVAGNEARLLKKEGVSVRLIYGWLGVLNETSRSFRLYRPEGLVLHFRNQTGAAAPREAAEPRAATTPPDRVIFSGLVPGEATWHRTLPSSRLEGGIRVR